jgi:hypothetical protein
VEGKGVSQSFLDGHVESTDAERVVAVAVASHRARKQILCRIAKQSATACAVFRFDLMCACHVPGVQPSQSATFASFQLNLHQPCRQSFRQSCLQKIVSICDT